MEVDEQNESSEDMFADHEEKNQEENTDDRLEHASENCEQQLLKKRNKPLTHWKDTKVFVQYKNWTLPYPGDKIDIWDNYHVRLPWSSHNEFPKDGKIVKR